MVSGLKIGLRVFRTGRLIVAMRADDIIQWESKLVVKRANKKNPDDQNVEVINRGRELDKGPENE